MVPNRITFLATANRMVVTVRGEKGKSFERHQISFVQDETVPETVVQLTGSATKIRLRKDTTQKYLFYMSASVRRGRCFPPSMISAIFVPDLKSSLTLTSH